MGNENEDGQVIRTYYHTHEIHWEV